MRAGIMIALAAACILASACGTADSPAGEGDTTAPGAPLAQHAAQAQTAQPGPTTPATSPAQATSDSGDAPMELSAIESLVIQDLAGYLGVAVADIAVTGTEERTWYDGGLGCHARRALGDPLPVPGYLITLEHAAKTYPYHTDRNGGFVRCLEPGKPIDPISR